MVKIAYIAYIQSLSDRKTGETVVVRNSIMTFDERETIDT